MHFCARECWFARQLGGFQWQFAKLVKVLRGESVLFAGRR